MEKEPRLPHVVVLGAGFGGLTFCQKFRKARARVTLVDRQNHHLFQPLLYQVATAGLSAPDIAQPIRSILAREKNVTVVMDEVRDIRLAEKKVYLVEEVLEYDYLVIALGSITSYFGHPEWEPFALGLKSLDDAVAIRRKVLLGFECAEIETDPIAQRNAMTIVVVGGGPTGVEMAGALAELAYHVLRKDFRRIDPSRARIILVEASPRVLAHLPPDLSEKAKFRLERMGVEVHTGVKVKEITKGRVVLEDYIVEADTIIWAAGVGAHPITAKLGVALDKAGRIQVNPDLSIPQYPNVFAIGDLATVLQLNGKPVPGVSPAAMQMGRHVAKIIQAEITVRDSRLEDRKPFRYWDKGTMATIGRSAAVVEMANGRLRFSGFFAWLSWLVVHLLFLVGFRNKIQVMIQWAYSYFTYKRGARIITGLYPPKTF